MRTFTSTPVVWAVLVSLAVTCPRADASDFQTSNKKGQALFDLGDYEEALESWRRALSLKPRSLETLVRIGTALTRLERYREAETAFRQCLDLDPKSAMAHYHLGALFMHERRFRPARKNLKLALKHTSWYPNAHYLLGYILEQEGAYKEAAKEYVAELNVNPSSVDAWYHLLDLQKQGKVGRNWDRKVVWTPKTIVGVSLAMAIGLGVFILGCVKSHARSRANPEQIL